MQKTGIDKKQLKIGLQMREGEHGSQSLRNSSNQESFLLRRELEGEELLFQKWIRASWCKCLDQTRLDQTRRCLDQARLVQKEALKLCMHTTIKLTSYIITQLAVEQ